MKAVSSPPATLSLPSPLHPARRSPRCRPFQPVTLRSSTGSLNFPPNQVLDCRSIWQQFLSSLTGLAKAPPHLPRPAGEGAGAPEGGDRLVSGLPERGVSPLRKDTKTMEGRDPVLLHPPRPADPGAARR